jgi:hypothetical protein
MATCRGGEGEPTMAVTLDEEGEVVDILKLNFMNERYEDEGESIEGERRGESREGERERSV